jgi:hypothetical protein
VDLQVVTVEERFAQEDDIMSLDPAKRLGDGPANLDTLYIRYDGQICRGSFDRDTTFGDVRQGPLTPAWQRARLFDLNAGNGRP